MAQDLCEADWATSDQLEVHDRDHGCGLPLGHDGDHECFLTGCRSHISRQKWDENEAAFQRHMR